MYFKDLLDGQNDHQQAFSMYYHDYRHRMALLTLSICLYSESYCLSIYKLSQAILEGVILPDMIKKENIIY
jgi:hypothetical protein